MENQNTYNYIRLPEKEWSDGCIAILGLVSQHNHVIRYGGFVDLADVELPITFYVPKTLLKSATGSLTDQNIILYFSPSYFPMKETGYFGEDLPLKTEKGFWEYELSHKQYSNYWMYEIHEQKVNYRFYVPKRLMAHQKPPRRLLVNISSNQHQQ